MDLDAARILNYAQKNYKAMLRQPDGHLKHPFLVPGSVYADHLWDWDSWLANVALRQFVEEDIREYERGSILNFLHVMDETGRMPIMVSATEFLPRNYKTDETNLHKPCLAQHAAFLVKEDRGEISWLAEHFEKICRFVDYYVRFSRHENGLYFWLDDSAIGVDNDPCTFYRPKKSSASIYLNCLMYQELCALIYLGDCLGEDTSFYQAEKDHLKTATRSLCFDEKDGMYYSADVNLLPITDAWLHSGAVRHWDSLIQRIGVWSGFMTMWSGIATPEEAERMVKENLLDQNAFWAPWGVRTLSKYEKMYRVVASGNPSCWLGPVWGISNYMVFRGLVKYGFEEEAEELAVKTLRLFSKDLEESGTLHEYYHPETGKPVINPGFQNWNLLSLNMHAWLAGKRISAEF